MWLKLIFIIDLSGETARLFFSSNPQTLNRRTILWKPEDGVWSDEATIWRTVCIYVHVHAHSVRNYLTCFLIIIIRIVLFLFTGRYGYQRRSVDTACRMSKRERCLVVKKPRYELCTCTCTSKQNDFAAVPTSAVSIRLPTPIDVGDTVCRLPVELKSEKSQQSEDGMWSWRSPDQNCVHVQIVHAHNSRSKQNDFAALPKSVVSIRLPTPMDVGDTVCRLPVELKSEKISRAKTVCGREKTTIWRIGMQDCTIMHMHVWATPVHGLQ